MNKLLKFCRVPLAIISAILFVISLATLLTMEFLPHTNKYSYNKKLLGSEFKAEMTFKNQKFEISDTDAVTVQFDTNKVVVFDTTISKVGEPINHQQYVFAYEIRHGDLYVMNKSGVTLKLAEISASDIEFEEDNIIYNSGTLLQLLNNNTELMALLGEMELTCGWANTLTILSEVLTNLFGLLLLVSIVLIILCHFGILGKENNKSEKTATASNGEPEKISASSSNAESDQINNGTDS